MLTHQFADAMKLLVGEHKVGGTGAREFGCVSSVHAGVR
jgi:hypothetical protein